MIKKKLIRLKTRGARIRAHRKLWRWLAENSEKDKYGWPGWESNGGRYPDQPLDCFLCIYPCEKCPLVWPGKFCTYHGDLVGLFFLWLRAFSEETKTQLAKQIAELPVRKERRGK